MLADQMRQHLGIGIRFEGMAGFEQSVLEPLVVLDHSVVDQGDLAGLIQVRVGVFVGRGSVSSPAGVSNAQLAGDRLLLQERGQAFINFPLFLPQQ